jgi:von Willebrand factor type A domain
MKRLLFSHSVCPVIADIAILLDQSTSIVSADGGTANWQSMLNFVAQVISSFQVGPTLARFALVRFSSRAQLDFNYNNYNTSTALISYVRAMDIVGGESNTTGAFYILNTQVLPTRRTNTKSIVILITDGQPNLAVSTLYNEVNATKLTSEIFTIGVTNSVCSVLFSISLPLVNSKTVHIFNVL